MKRPRSLPLGLVASLLCVGIGLASTAVAAPGGHGPQRLSRLEDKVAALGLDAETRTAVYALIDEARTEKRELHTRLEEAHQALRSLLEQEDPDETAVLAQADVIGALRTESRKHELRTLLRVQALLTPEQRERLHQAMRGSGGPRFGRRR